MPPSNTATGPLRFRVNAESFSPSQPANIQMQQAAAAASQQAQQQQQAAAMQQQQMQAQMYPYYASGPPPMNPYYQYMPQPQFMPVPYGYMYTPQYAYAPSYQNYPGSPNVPRNGYYKNGKKKKEDERDKERSEKQQQIEDKSSELKASVDESESETGSKPVTPAVSEPEPELKSDIKEPKPAAVVPQLDPLDLELPTSDFHNTKEMYPIYVNCTPLQFATDFALSRGARKTPTGQRQEFFATIEPESSVKFINRGSTSSIIINYNDSLISTPEPQSKAKNWAAVLHSTPALVKKERKTVTKSVGVVPVAINNASSALSNAASALDSSATTDLGVLLLKLMFDPSYSPVSQRDLSVFRVKPRGLTNTGNICYMNLILQLLFYCEPFNRMLKLIQEKATGLLKPMTHPLLDLTVQFFEDFSTITNTGLTSKAMNPEKFYFSLTKLSKFSHLKWGQQEDAEEMLGYFLDGLQEEFASAIKNLESPQLDPLLQHYANDKTVLANIHNTLKIIKGSDQSVGLANTVDESEGGWSEVGSNRKLTAKRTVEIEPTPVTSLFGGQFRSVLTVPKSKELQSITLDPFQNIQLDILDLRINTIEDAFKIFNEPESIPFKSSSNQEVVAKKQTFIDQLPNIMVIHLKRFAFQVLHQSHGMSFSSATTSSSESSPVSTSTSTILESSPKANSSVTSSSSVDKTNTSNNEPPATFSNHSEQTHQASKVEGSYNGFNGGISNSYSHYGGGIEKITKKVQYLHSFSVPSECVTKKLTTSKNYRLIGVVYHHGNSAGGGHYTCDVLRRSSVFDEEEDQAGKKVDNEWIRIDDTQVSAIDRSEVVTGEKGSKTAYILMYQKV